MDKRGRTIVRPSLLLPVLTREVKRRREALIVRLSRNLRMGPVPEGHTTPCRLYQGTQFQGYPNITFCGEGGTNYVVRAHRLFWVLTHAREIPPGMEPDHTCQNRACVVHLDLVTKAENIGLRNKRNGKNGRQ